MKYFVISDTHSHINKALEIFKVLKDIDAIIHLGDLQEDAKNLEKALNIDVINVKGNMDGSYSNNDYKILETEFGEIYLAHGHMEKVKSSLQNLIYRAEELGCKAALFGHTHKPLYQDINGFYLLNPGSLTFPSDGTQGSYAILNIEKDKFEASIVYYQNIIELQSRKKSPKKTPIRGGFLKDLLNNSDRF